MNTVHWLRTHNYKVRIEHRRRYWDPVNKRWSFLTRYERGISALPEYVKMVATGGYTTATVTHPINADNTFSITTVGIAKCSKHDLYNKKVGVTLALEEALGGALPDEQVNEQCDCDTICKNCKCLDD